MHFYNSQGKTENKITKAVVFSKHSELSWLKLPRDSEGDEFHSVYKDVSMGSCNENSVGLYHNDPKQKSIHSSYALTSLTRWGRAKHFPQLGGWFRLHAFPFCCLVTNIIIIFVHTKIRYFLFQ